MPEAIARLIERDFGLKAAVATEIEFYLHGVGGESVRPATVDRIEEECGKAGIVLFRAEAERGPDQYEVSFPYSFDVSHIERETERFKALMAGLFTEPGIIVDFSAKPRRDIPGSGLHVHVHLEDTQSRNVFYREGEEFSPLLLNAVGGLLALANPCMSIFAPRPESFERFLYTENSYLVCPAASNVTSTVSWGTNNRTVAVRLPSKPANNKHIEHRIAGSDADTAQVLAAVLAGVHYGLKEKCDPGEPVYGDASLPQYNMPKLVTTAEEAKECRKNCGAMKGYF